MAKGRVLGGGECWEWVVEEREGIGKKAEFGKGKWYGKGPLCLTNKDYHNYGLDLPLTQSILSNKNENPVEALGSVESLSDP